MSNIDKNDVERHSRGLCLASNSQAVQTVYSANIHRVLLLHSFVYNHSFSDIQDIFCWLQHFKMRFTLPVRNMNKLMDLKSLKMLDHYSQFNPRPLTIQQFMEFGKLATEEESFTFLSKEIPVRLSNIMKEINLLPSNLLQMPSVLILQENIKSKSF